jgi:DNA-binding PadR family transcriptional regulator
MVERGWLKRAGGTKGGRGPRKAYSITNKGRKVLAILSDPIEELHREVVRGEKGTGGRLPSISSSGRREH